MSHIEMMRLAEKVALQSVCKRAQVGAVLAHGWVTFEGFNRNLGGGACECEDGKTLKTVIHAERMAIGERMKYLSSPAYDMSHLKNIELHSNCGVLYVTRQPCFQCAQRIVKDGIKSIYYRDADDKVDGIEHLLAHGIAVDSRWIQGQTQDRWADRWPKKLDQSIFDDAPDWAEWAFVCEDGVAMATSKKPRFGDSKVVSGVKCFYTIGSGVDWEKIGEGFDVADWRNSLIKRERSARDACPQNGDGVCCGGVR